MTNGFMITIGSYTSIGALDDLGMVYGSGFTSLTMPAIVQQVRLLQERLKAVLDRFKLRCWLCQSHESYFISPIGSMYATYGNMDPINKPPLC